MKTNEQLFEMLQRNERILNMQHAMLQFGIDCEYETKTIDKTINDIFCIEFLIQMFDDDTEYNLNYDDCENEMKKFEKFINHVNEHEHNGICENFAYHE